MKIVERAGHPPGKCILSGDMDGPFIDTGVWANQVDPYIYLHVPVVEYMAREMLEMVPKSEVQKLREELESYQQRVAELEEFAEAHERFHDAMEQVA